MKKLLLAILFYSSFYFSQISIGIKINDGDKNNLKDVKNLQIKIKNNSDKSYAIPIDISEFKAFYLDEYCNDYSLPENYQDLKFKICVEDLKDNQVLTAFPKFKLSGLIDEKDHKVIAEMKRRERLIQIQNKEISYWSNKNKINQKNDWILKNKSLYTNFIFLKPKEEIVYNKRINLGEFNVDKISGNYEYYDLDDSKYKLSLKYCIDNKVYDYLTIEQKIKLKKFNLFAGKIESNKIDLN